MKRIEIINTGYNHYTVIVDDKFADHLTVDETIGCVASALFSPNPLFIRSYSEWAEREARWKREEFKPDGLIGGKTQ